MTPDPGQALLFVVGGLLLAWISMLGLLWRRSLVGMLVGVLVGWAAAVVVTLGFVLRAPTAVARSEGSLLVVAFALVGGAQLALGLGLVLARVVRRGSLDAQDAELLEG